MRKFIIAFLFVELISLNSCTSSNDFNLGRRQLETQGYTDVQNTGYSFFCCKDEDGFSTGFSAIDKDGNRVEGAFCSSLIGGVTIRFK